MTAEQFLEHIGRAKNYGDQGKVRRARASVIYGYYVQAYRATSLEALVLLAATVGYGALAAVKAACADRDAGRPMIVIEEFTEEK